jgi:hypothetical protein
LRFASFFMAGFECATGYNKSNEWIDQVAATQHERFADQDYAAAAAAGLKTVREGIRWPLVDNAGGYDFSTVVPFVRAAHRHDVQPIWDLFHYGYPTDLDPFSDAFVDRFADYCFEAAGFLKSRMTGPLLFTPVNEPSYFAWAGGESAHFAPYRTGMAYELKVQLIRAAIKGIDAIWTVCPDAVIVNADPVCRQVVPVGRPDLIDEVHRFNEAVVFESYDLLSGRLLPELGGSSAHLGISGINYYWTNQWEHGRPLEPLASDDERLWTLADIVRWTWHRYGSPVAITETSHWGDQRGPWLKEVTNQVKIILDEQIPLLGVCLYPVLGMPEWHVRQEWAHMGLWDVTPDLSGVLQRSLHKPMYEALREAHAAIEPAEVQEPRWKKADITKI